MALAGFDRSEVEIVAERDTLQAEIAELINEQERIKASGASGFPAKKARNAEIEQQVGTLRRDKIEIDTRTGEYRSRAN